MTIKLIFNSNAIFKSCQRTLFFNRRFIGKFPWTESKRMYWTWFRFYLILKLNHFWFEFELRMYSKECLLDGKVSISLLKHTCVEWILVASTTDNCYKHILAFRCAMNSLTLTGPVYPIALMQHTNEQGIETIDRIIRNFMQLHLNKQKLTGLNIEFLLCSTRLNCNYNHSMEIYFKYSSHSHF